MPKAKTGASKYELPDETKKQIADQQIEQFKQERYNHVLNVDRLNALPDSDEKTAALAAAEESIAAIESAIDVTLDAKPQD